MRRVALILLLCSPCAGADTHVPGGATAAPACERRSDGRVVSAFGSSAASAMPATLWRVRAREIIDDELKKAGVSAPPSDLLIDGVTRINRLRRYYTREMREKNPQLGLHSNETRIDPLHFDGVEPRRSIGYLYLESRDCYDLRIGPLEVPADKRDLDLPAQARRVATQAATQKAVRDVAVFYDPL